jgi:hypothetical protein
MKVGKGVYVVLKTMKEKRIISTTFSKVFEKYQHMW